ncbi:MAG: 30S ribosomal protein S7 [Candidatus Woesearchaeota archaeon]|nr:30S ribosomal protein S7 [Candidatus Woesearchaeota archaeon]
MDDYKIFNRWSVKEIRVEDAGLRDYITLTPLIVPRTGGRNFGTRFNKSKTNIVERFMNKIMVSGHKGKKHFKTSGRSTGKAQDAYKIMESTLELIEKRANKNPIAVLVKAIENAAPREDITRLTRGGISYTQAVDISPMKRVDESIKNIALAAFQQSFNTKVSAQEALAKEIILAAKGEASSFAIKRRDEIERIAKASR